MRTLRAAGFDFRFSFPVPLDEVRHRAGRQGVLDQKADAAMSDADWIAFQHQAWCDELCGYHAERDYLFACIKAHIDPGTGRAPHAATNWAAIECRARAEALHADDIMLAIFGDYADHFGRAASEAFQAFVLEAHRACGECGPPQRSLFA